ncbi:UNVERIFIED_CONTAM: E3 ubiquitin-protein ligase Mdm2 [Trichonephila clavipes]
MPGIFGILLIFMCWLSQRNCSTTGWWRLQESPPKINQYDSPSTSQENLSLPSSSYSSEGGSQSPKNESKDLSAKLCIICCSKPINSSIIHGKVGHSVSCYRCARKLQSRNDRCPICRRYIERVVYLISN